MPIKDVRYMAESTSLIRHIIIIIICNEYTKQQVATYITDVLRTIVKPT